MISFTCVFRAFPEYFTPGQPLCWQFCPPFFFFFFFFFFWLCWVFVAVHGLSLVVGSGCYSSLRCVGISLRWLLLLQSKGLSSCGRVGSVVVAHGL